MGLLHLSITIIAAYVIGSISFADLVSKAKGVDLRTVGSKNLGATNVYRNLGLNYAALVFLLDALKGYLPTLYAIHNFENPYLHIGIGLMTIVGHSLTMFAGFKGGKGAATGLGVLLAISPIVFIILFPLAITLIKITRYVAPNTIICAILAPILLWWFDYPDAYTLVVGLTSAFIIYRHKANIQRLINGTENKV